MADEITEDVFAYLEQRPSEAFDDYFAQISTWTNSKHVFRAIQYLTENPVLSLEQQVVLKSFVKKQLIQNSQSKQNPWWAVLEQVYIAYPEKSSNMALELMWQLGKSIELVKSGALPLAVEHSSLVSSSALGLLMYLMVDEGVLCAITSEALLLVIDDKTPRFFKTCAQSCLLGAINNPNASDRLFGIVITEIEADIERLDSNKRSEPLVAWIARWEQAIRSLVAVGALDFQQIRDLDLLKAGLKLKSEKHLPIVQASDPIRLGYGL